MADYSEDIADAVEMISEAGVMCQLRRGTADIDVPVFFSFFAPQVIDGDLIMVTDRQAFLPGGLSRNPDAELDRLIIPPCDLYPNGDSVRIVKATPTAPNGQVILWELQLRK